MSGFGTTALAPSRAAFERIVADLVAREWDARAGERGRDEGLGRDGRDGRERDRDDDRSRYRYGARKRDRDGDRGIDFVCRPDRLEGGRCGVRCLVEQSLPAAAAEETVESARAFDPSLAEVALFTTAGRDHELAATVGERARGRPGDPAVRVLFREDVARLLGSHQDLLTDHCRGPLVADGGAGGFRRLSDADLGGDGVGDPETAWRTGFSFGEVAAGFAFARAPVVGGDRVAPADRVEQRLADGADTVVVGPPGTGKRTTLRAVACRWHGGGRGPVFYRRADALRPVGDPGALAARFAETDGHALVVVEDAMRPGAAPVFEALDRLGDDPDASFLLAARTSEWRDPGGVFGGPAPAGRDRVGEFHVPALDADECASAGDHFETVTAADVDVSGETVHGAVAGAEAGELVALAEYLLASAAGGGSPPDGEGSPLEAGVAGAYAGAYRDERDEVRRRVAVLVALLGAAGLGVRESLVHALGPDDGHEAVADALDALDGTLVFGRDGRDPGRLRSRPGSWHAQFLAGLVEDAGQDAAATVADCANALFALADDPAAAESVRGWLGRSDAALELAADRPGALADRLVEAVFSVGVRWPSLSPLLGATGESGIELPGSCSPAGSVVPADCRGRMQLALGAHDRAEAEFEAVVRRAGDRLGGDERTAVERRGRHGLGLVERARGDLDAAEGHHRGSLDLARDLGDARAAARSLHHLGLVADARGDADEAESLHRRSLECWREAGDRRGAARAHGNLGAVAQARGDLDAAVEHHEERLELERALGNRRGEARALGNLGGAALARGDVDAAETYLERELSCNREVGDERGEALSLRSLGLVARERGDWELARERFKTATETFFGLAAVEEALTTALNLVEAHEETGNPTDAVETCEFAISAARDLGFPDLAERLRIRYATLDERDRGESTGELYYLGLRNVFDPSPRTAVRLFDAAWGRRGEFDEGSPGRRRALSAGVLLVALAEVFDLGTGAEAADIRETAGASADDLPAPVVAVLERLDGDDPGVTPEELEKSVEPPGDDEELSGEDAERLAAAALLDALD